MKYAFLESFEEELRYEFDHLCHSLFCHQQKHMAIGIILERARKRIADEADHLIGSIFFLFIFIGVLQSGGNSKHIWTHNPRMAPGFRGPNPCGLSIRPI
ncbi:MAG: hypothetical protein IKE24_07400 [Clostridia bacterium]|nr:hypothetical protein [Clostridia bacterium]